MDAEGPSGAGGDPGAATPAASSTTTKAAKKRPAMPRWTEAIPAAADLTDPLALNAVAHRALGIGLIQVLQAVGVPLAQRVKMLCELTGRMAPLTPMSRLYDAERLVRGDVDGLKPKTGPKMEPVNASQTGPLAPTDRGGTARRGRPRKRSMG